MLTWKRIFKRSSGAVAVRETTPATAPAAKYYKEEEGGEEEC